jgi:hypothetical protein
VSSEKELGFGWGRGLEGKAREDKAPQKRVYKGALERIGVRNAICAVKRAGRVFDSV